MFCLFLSSHTLQKYTNFNVQHSFVEYAMKFVGFGEEGGNKITECRGPEVRDGGTGLHNGERLIVTAYALLLGC